MEIYIVSNNPEMTSRVVNGLKSLGMQLPLSHVVNRSSSLDQPNKAGSRIIFICYELLSDSEIHWIENHRTRFKDDKLIAVSRTSKPEDILRVVRAGTIDYLDITAFFESELKKLLNRICVKQSGTRENCQVISVVSATGGSGASLVAVSLAAVLADLNDRSLLIDANLTGGDLAAMLNLSPRFNLLSLAERQDQIDSKMFEQCLTEHGSGIYLLASPELFSDVRQITSQFILKLIELAKKEFRRIIIDAANVRQTEHLSIVSNSDKVVITMRPDFISLYRTKKYLELLLLGSVQKDRITIAVNRSNQPKQISLKDIKSVLDVNSVLSISEDCDAANTSVNLGVPMVLTAPRSKASKDVIALSKGISQFSDESTVKSTSRLTSLSSRLTSPRKSAFF